MSREQREQQLGLYWDAAAAEVYRKHQQTAQPPGRQEPPPIGGTQQSGSMKGGKLAEDPALSRMAAAFKFTPEQQAEIEAYL